MCKRNAAASILLLMLPLCSVTSVTFTAFHASATRQLVSQLVTRSSESSALAIWVLRRQSPVVIRFRFRASRGTSQKHILNHNTASAFDGCLNRIINSSAPDTAHMPPGTSGTTRYSRCLHRTETSTRNSLAMPCNLIASPELGDVFIC